MTGQARQLDRSMHVRATSSEKPIGGLRAQELAAVVASARTSRDDGLSWCDQFERDLAETVGAASAVVVSSDAAMLTVLLGAFGARRGDAFSHALPDLPGWIAGAAHLAGVRILRHTNGEGLFHLVPPGASAGPPSLQRITLSCGAPPRDWADIFATSSVMLVPLTEGQPLSTGEGGALLFSDCDLAHRARLFATFGGLDGVTRGVNHKLSAVQCALGLVRLSSATGRAFPLARTRVADNPARLPGATIDDRFDPATPADAPLLARALTRDLSGQGETVAQFEAALAHWYDADEAVAVSSGYAAVLTSLLALGLEAGDEVLLTPTCPLCTVYALEAIGVTPVFCDTHPDVFSIDLEAAHQAIGPRTRAIIEIPMWGYPVPADAVAEFARSHKLGFILDLALGHGIELHDRHIWHHADVATFSTHASKMLVTGEGGFVLAKTPEQAARLRAARGRAAPPSAAPAANFHLSGLQAALGLSRLPILHSHIEQRRRKMEQLAHGLTHPDLAPLPVLRGGRPSGVKLLVRHRAGAGAALNRHLAQAGVPSDILTYACRPLYEFPILAARRTECPNAKHLLSSIATLPVHPDISEKQVRQMCDALNSLPEGLCA